MAELTSYQVSDFILFSGPVYYRQFELYNRAIWPLHLLAVLLALVILYSLWKKPAWAGRTISLLLVISWVWVAVVFLYQRFYQIHVVADLYAFAFIIQAGLVAWFGLVKDDFSFYPGNRMRIASGTILVLSGLVIYPFIAALTGRNWLQLEMFALAPDPTAFVTLGLLLFYRASALLHVIPTVWLLVSYTTLAVM